MMNLYEGQMDQPYANQGIQGGGQELLADDQSSQQQQYGQEDDNQMYGQEQNQTGDEHLSVYMMDNNVLMRRIQIEGDDREFLMDPDGKIFDLNGVFIGTANTNELEELNEDSQQQQNQQEEMMLLDDDEDVVTTNQNDPTPTLKENVN